MADALRNLQHAIAQCQDAVFITDAVGVISRVNPAFERITGYSTLEVIGKDLSLILEGGALGSQYRQIRRHAVGENQYVCTLHVKCKSGVLADLDVTLTPVRGNCGRLVSLVGTGHPSVPTTTPQADSSHALCDDPALARLVHDLRNILMIALAHADMANQVTAADHPARTYVENAKSAVQSAAALILQFTDGLWSGSAWGVAANGALRAQQPAHKTNLPASPPRNSAKPATILLVEDEPLLRESTASFLTRAGFQVLAAESAEEALATVATNPEPVDLLIAEGVLPGMSGAALAEILISARPATKVLLVSAFAKTDLEPPVALAPAHVLVRPFLFSALHEKVLALLCDKKPALGVSSAS